MKNILINYGYCFYLGVFSGIMDLSFVKMLLLFVPVMILVEIYKEHAVNERLIKDSYEPKD